MVTFYIFPHSWVYFGVIHFILIASIVGVFFVGKPFLSFLTASILFVLYKFNIISMHPLFKKLAPLLHLPTFTQDLVPFIPWFSSVLLGITFASYRLHLKVFTINFFNSNDNLSNLIRFLGQNSLAVYLIHQPLLFRG